VTLLLLHGFTGAPSSWDGVVGRLPPGAKVLRPPLLGHDPRRMDARDGFVGEVDRIASWLRDERHASLHLAGYSLGARVALGLLGRHGDLFARATLLGVNPGLDDADRAARLTVDERWARIVEREGVARFVERWLAQPLFASQAALPWSTRAVARARRLRHSPDGLALALRTLGLGAMPDLRPMLPDVRVPVRLLAGAGDEKFRALAVATASAMPRATVVVVPRAGHDLLLERPGAVAAALLIEEEEKQP
jgi:2-succinyl-6-hydroxy-2,4-cyclohexadiene-1-carboxylate synthase